MNTKEVQSVIGLGLLVGLIVGCVILVKISQKKPEKIERKHE